MKKKFLVLFLLIMFFMPVYAKEDKYTIVSGDIETIGSEICFDTECFYVFGNDGNTVKMLAKYNLYVGGKDDNGWIAYGDEATGMQDSAMLGWINTQNIRNGVTAFSNNEKKGEIYSDYSGSIVEEYVNNYKKILEEEFEVLVLKARLITKEELTDSNTFACPFTGYCSDKYSWLYSATYWTDAKNGDTGLWVINSNGIFSYAECKFTSNNGVRPVIEVPVGWFDKEGTVYVGSIKKVKSSENVISNDDTSVDVIFNDLSQQVKYEAIIYNDTNNDMYVNMLDVINSSEEFIEYKLDSKSENIMIEANGSTKVTFYINTLALEGAGRNVDDEVKINFMVSDKIYNPQTFSNIIEIIILVVILGGTIYFIRRNKKKKLNTFILLICLSVIGIKSVWAYDFISVELPGTVKYVSQNLMETTGTVLNDKSADYTNSKDVWAYYDKVKNIYIKSLVNEPKKYFEKFDLTLDDGERVTAYLVENDDEEVPYDLYIMSNGVVIANENSSFLFSFPNVEKIDGLSNVDFSGTTNMQGMFIGNTKLEDVEIDAIDLTNVTDTSFMFYDNKRLDVTIKDFDVSNVENMKYMTQNYLYDIIKSKSVNDSNLDYLTSTDSGNFLYNKSENNENPIYYYRGDVDDNNVKFAGYCWLMVRTTETGGIKLLYNGSPDENGNCIEHNSNATLPNAETFSAFNYHLGAVGYMYGDTVSIKGKKLTSVTSEYMYGNDVVYDEETNMYTLIDTISTSNWAEDMDKVMKKYHYSCFNETGTCSKVYYITDPSNTISTSGSTVYVKDSYYIELTSGKKFVDAIKASQKNINNSNAKKVVDNWFVENLINYNNYLEDEKWCNDRTISSGSLSSKDYDTSLSNINYFSSNDRIKYTYKDGFTYFNPSLTCENNNDNFTVSEDNGNGALTYPIALLTADELGLIGGLIKTNDKYFYTDKSWWTMTSKYMAEDWTYAYRFSPGSTYNNIINYSSMNAVNINVSGSGYIRPAISLKSGTQFVTGDGTVNNPYVIE